MTTITIRDEPTRTVLLHALWDHASDVIGGGDTFHEDVWECGWAPIHPRLSDREDPRAVLDAKLAALLSIREEADRLMLVPIGQAAVVSLDSAQLADTLRSCRLGIEENPDLWCSLPPSERGRVLACRDVAATLVGDLANENGGAA
jgi:hypothetical protein